MARGGCVAILIKWRGRDYHHQEKGEAVENGSIKGHCATSRKVAGSIPDEVIRFFN
jgi:hypothetical protein